MDIRFEQREPPTEDKVTQINLGDGANPRPIFISELISLREGRSDISCARVYRFFRLKLRGYAWA